MTWVTVGAFAAGVFFTLGQSLIRFLIWRYCDWLVARPRPDVRRR